MSHFIKTFLAAVLGGYIVALSILQIYTPLINDAKNTMNLIKKDAEIVRDLPISLKGLNKTIKTATVAVDNHSRVYADNYAAIAITINTLARELALTEKQVDQLFTQLEKIQKDKKWKMD